MSAIQQMFLGNSIPLTDYTLKTFTTDDRTSNGFTLTQAFAGTNVSGGYWNSLLTDGNGFLFKGYTEVKTGSIMKIGGIVRATTWGGQISCRMEDSVQNNIQVEAALKASSSFNSAPSKFAVTVNNSEVFSFNTSNGTYYHVELKKISSGFQGTLFASDGVTVLATHTVTSAYIPKGITFWNRATTDNQQSADYCESNIYY